MRGEIKGKMAVKRMKETAAWRKRGGRKTLNRTEK